MFGMSAFQVTLGVPSALPSPPSTGSSAGASATHADSESDPRRTRARRWRMLTRGCTVRAKCNCMKSPGLPHHGRLDLPETLVAIGWLNGRSGSEALGSGHEAQG